MKKSISSTVPIFIFSIIIAVFGASQILNASRMAENIPDFLPASRILTYISGACLILAAVSFIIDRMARLAGYLLALLLLLIVFVVDIPGIVNASDHAARSLFTTNGFKDAALAMAAIIIGNLSKH